MTDTLDLFGTDKLNMSGPLMTTTIAIFGNQSFFYIASKASSSSKPSAIEQICQQDKMPFSGLP